MCHGPAVEPITKRQRTWLVGYLLVRAVVVTVIGLLLVLRPTDTAHAVARIAGGLLLAIGVIDLVAPILRGSTRRLRFPLVIRGLVAIAIAFAVLLMTDATITVVSIILGIQLVVGGGVSLMVSVRLRDRVKGWVGFAIRGAVSVAAGAVAIGWPGITVTALAAVLGVQWLLSGVLSTVIAVRVAGSPTLA
jgi:uncharacterized membrane protein HdeD (DUF308 family)